MQALRPLTASAASLRKLAGAFACAVLGAAACQDALDLGGYDFTPPASSGGAAGMGTVPASGAGGSSKGGSSKGGGSGKNGGSGSGGAEGNPGGIINFSTGAGGSTGIRTDDSSGDALDALSSASDAGSSDAGLSDAGSAEAGSSAPDAAIVPCTKPSCRGGSGLLLNLLGGARNDP
jgi:hypothetical protein